MLRQKNEQPERLMETHHRGAEDAEGAQRKQVNSRSLLFSSPRPLRVLCVSAVNATRPTLK